MKKDFVPQDKISTYSGHKKLMYAVDNDGQYDRVKSSGWDIEEHATVTAIDEFNRLADNALTQAHSKHCSPLQYHMYHNRMDISLLSQTTGLFQWRIKRHLRPVIFSKLKNNLLQRYGEALGISIKQLQTLPEK